MNQPTAELLSLSDIAFIHNLDEYSADLEVYFLQHWTIDKFIALRKGSTLSVNSLKFLTVFTGTLHYGTLLKLPNPRIILSFRKRRSDNIGFVLVFVDKKGW